MRNLAASAVMLCLGLGWSVDRGLVRAQGAPVNQGLTAVAGLKVGHHTLAERPTGCTVILAEGEGAVGGVSQQGGAPGTRETDALDPLNLVDKVNAIVLGKDFGKLMEVQFERDLQGRVIIRIRKVAATPSKYPRAPGMPFKKPLVPTKS